MRKIAAPLFYLFAALYPAVVFVLLVLLKIPARVISLCIMFFCGCMFLAATSGKKRSRHIKFLLSSAVLFVLGTACCISGADIFLKLYPVLINGMLLGFFSFSLVSPPTVIFRLAVMQKPSIRGSIAAKRVEAYCFRVTLIWCAFFLLNGTAAAYTVFCASGTAWSVYNGGISYALMGLLFAGEFMVRRIVDKKMPVSVPFSQFAANSHAPDMVVCYEKKWSDGCVLTWNDFLIDSAKLRQFINAPEHSGSDSWILHCDDYYYFLAAFTALLQCGKKILLTANISPAFIAEIQTDASIRFLTDQNISGADFVPDILDNAAAPSEAERNTTPAIIADETHIIMYTSGSTGHPKQVHQRLTEFETDNAFVLSKWGDEFLKRKLCSTVSQHHIYGLLFGILLPFTAGVPFRRKRIVYPEEFETLTDDSYMIIATPAFLKRSVEAEHNALHLNSCWIFTSGGVLTKEIAEASYHTFGFWPLEVYGSTETSGIAYRQSKNGLSWTPFDNAEIWKNEDGCLVVRSPYIQDPAGFVTGDLIEMQENGQFLLKGRADSIVKIEEKRISVTEVENRILQSGFVSDVCVVPITEKRQYLAAAIVLNEAGRQKFKDTEKYLINRFFRNYTAQFFEAVVLPRKWRYLDAIPADVQGKKKKQEIQSLFVPENGHGIPCEQLVRKTDAAADIAVFIPAESDYFDGHFPDYPLLSAAAQIDLAAHFADRYFGAGKIVPDIKRCKFISPIKPDASLLIHLEYRADSGTLSFAYAAPDENTLFSSGTLTVKDEA
ncbi:MAG: AMP-binding protein [Bacteroides sp.]|nr:AMP-binding protein [Prevotella sp.]MCM1408015.1 AMP-binding protein [Treponema brennaborense]MCM1468991.1 AMP-binding protein [Bacteroides sp.]